MPEGGEKKPIPKNVQDVFHRVSLSLQGNLKKDKWARTVGTDGNVEAVQKFLAVPENRILLAHYTGDSVYATLEMPHLSKLSTKKKACALVKVGKPSKITEKNFNDSILTFEFSGSRPLDGLMRLFSNVYEPVLATQENRTEWSAPAEADVMASFRQFASELYIVHGRSHGRTLLPVPQPESYEGLPLQKRVHALEGAVVMWTKQMSTAITNDPSLLFLHDHHPEPHEELEFWKAKSEDLSSLKEQLSSAAVKGIQQQLTEAGSLIASKFVTLQEKVWDAAYESSSNHCYLETLKQHFSTLRSTLDFKKLTKVFEPMLHTILLVWKHSPHYNRPERLLTLVQMINNAIIKQANKFVSGEEIFRFLEEENVAEAVEKLAETLEVSSQFKHQFLNYRTKAIAELGGPDQPKHKTWMSVSMDQMFERFDMFQERCRDIKEFIQLVQQFAKLEKVHIGGTKGRELTEQVHSIHDTFVGLKEALKDAPYDLLDIADKRFDDDFYKFRHNVKELERRLAELVCQAMDDLPSLAVKWSLINSFEDLLTRPIILDKFESKQDDLLRAILVDMQHASQEFKDQCEEPPTGWNLPPRAGAIYWAKSFEQRVTRNKDSLEALLKSVPLTSETHKDHYLELCHTYDRLRKEIAEYKRGHLKEWTATIDEATAGALKKKVLLRLESGRLRVNFDPKMVAFLREVKYLTQAQHNVPPKALTIYKKADAYSKMICHLQLVVNRYNGMLSSLNEVEKPLLQRNIDEIDKIVKEGIEHIDWNNRDADEFIGRAEQATLGVYGLFKTMKNNVSTLKSKLEDFASQPLAERKTSKAQSVEELGEMIAKRQRARFGELEGLSEEIGKLLMEINSALKMSTGDPKWKAYVDYAQSLIGKGLSEVVKRSITWMAQQIDPATAGAGVPLVEIQLGLVKGDIRFLSTNKLGAPAAAAQQSDDVWTKMAQWVDSFFTVGAHVQKLDKDADSSDFEQDLRDHVDLVACVEEFTKVLRANQDECNRYREKFTQFDGLYTLDRNKEFKKFLTEKRAPDAGEDEVPALNEFAEQLKHYKQVSREIKTVDTPEQFDWLKVDAQPVKQALSTWVSKWSHTYTSFLKNHVVERITGLNKFMRETMSGFGVKPTSGDLESLKFTLNLIHQVRTRHAATVKMFEPLRAALEMLRAAEITVDEEVENMLEEAPLSWESTVDKAYKMKEAVNPLQNEQVDTIKKRIWDFSEVVAQFRSGYRENAPFNYVDKPTAVDEAYASITEWHGKIGEIEGQGNDLNELEKLFELNVTKFRSIHESRIENKQLKGLWDMICMVRKVFDSWKVTLWNEIDTELLMSKLKKLFKRVNGMDPGVKGWKAYQGLVEAVQNFETVLPLVDALHSETMKKRHWDQLMKSTNTRFDPHAPSFSLGDMLKLGLHNYVETVEEVVEISEKEHKIENQLKRMRATWTGAEAMQFEWGVHEETQTNQLRVPEEVTINLEEGMQILQAMKSQGKYVEHFIEEVRKWETNLGVAETVMQDWLMVQGKWSSLQNIFIGSADIREQLPEDSKRFDGIDAQWRELMGKCKLTPSVVDACTAIDIVDGKNVERSKMMESMKARMEKCEKSLNAYLETKKMAFPRFYFLSNSALLDLLSNGNNPQLVQQHMGDCFDNIKKLSFATDDKDCRDAIAMHSKAGGETVPLYKAFRCEGAVEDWLNGLVDMMRETLKRILEKAKDTADQWEIEKPRREWLYDYPAQIALTASQIVWSEEVEANFEALEDGNETALRDYYKVLESRLDNLIKLVQGKLNKRDRKKIMTLITVDVHNRDTVKMLMDKKIESNAAFAWQSQMRYRWDPEGYKCQVLVADAVRNYSYEYIGNPGRLVITPLTDRCYITLTQALKLIMGGAPAGPAGTGKTETVKDLGRAVGLPVYVFNCSEQMNVTSLGNIFKGLCQTGAWGCFDEFNRIPIEVLSVVATQVGAYLYALRAKQDEFDLMGTRIKLVETVGVFITMNPGYAGRTELPENIKAIFRSCAMVVPDIEMICENFLMAEGFRNARTLAHKFITLYSLSKDLCSKQTHYDWGLRACKAVLYVAGGMLRANPDTSETLTLMRALRDFNLPKIVKEDQPIFLRLIADLFPQMEVKRQIEATLQTAVEKCTGEMGLQQDDMFVRKVTELAELLDVRHSVFIIGPGGAGKSCVWKVLEQAYISLGQKVASDVINPKAVLNKELYGWLSQTTGDWFDGILSSLMRNMCKNECGFTEKHVWKWIVLDGDIDTEWIESLNTVMDDNKVLTLVSNERIPLSPSMRLLFEVSNVKNATPATVSRAGILFINASDVGWRPMIDTWIDQREEEFERSTLRALFNKYIKSDVLEHVRRNFKNAVPITDAAKLRSLTFILDGVLPSIESVKGKVDSQTLKAVYERHFIFAAIWALGGSLLEEHRAPFSGWWKKKFKELEFPMDADVEGTNLVFDYFYDHETNAIARWEDQVEAYDPPGMSNGPTFVNSLMVHTADTTRISYHLDLLVKQAHPALFVGVAGTGKTQVARNYLAQLPKAEFNSAVINLNSYSNETSLRTVMTQYVEKRSGRTYGPQGGKKLVYFIDDLNMPRVNTYGTQTPIALIRQHMDYEMWYETAESDPTRKKRLIRDCQYIACMNQKAGSFTVNDRLMAHFATFAFNPCSPADCFLIYNSIMSGHLESFEEKIRELSGPVTQATIDIVSKMANSSKFRANSKKFHYQFTLRDIANVTQGIVASKPGTLSDLEFVRLWRHECARVFGDRLINQADLDAFNQLARDIMKKNFDTYDQDALQAEPLLYTDFVGVKPGDDRNDLTYSPCDTFETLNSTLSDQLVDYNENNASMELVLFDMAMEHVARIAHIISSPCGNALLMGVGGSGKQSLTRLAAHICGCTVFQIAVTRHYGKPELLEDIKQLYLQAGVKGQGVVFMLTDTNIADEEWLVYINDFLSTGNIPGLFPQDELEGALNSIRKPAKQAGVDPDDQAAMYKFFISRVRANLHVVLCFSPVGETFRVRSRKFPALVNCTKMDWFFSWPRDALTRVAERFLNDEILEDLSDELKQNIAHHMAEVHLSVGEASVEYLSKMRRYNYTTPKSFLELIDFYKKLYKKKGSEVDGQTLRLQKGIAVLQKTAKDVSELQDQLKLKMKVVEEKKEAAAALIDSCGKESAKVDAEKKIALAEEADANMVLDEVNAIKADCEKELNAAMPALNAATEAANCLSKAAITEVKNNKNPIDEVKEVGIAILILYGGQLKKKNWTWKNVLKMMGSADAFMKGLKDTASQIIEYNFVDEKRLQLVSKFLSKDFFNKETMWTKSQAAANLCDWAINVVKLNEVVKRVEPKKKAADAAEGRYLEANARLDKVRAAVAAKEAELQAVKDELSAAVAEKQKVEDEARACQDRLALAERLVGGLSDENKRWGFSVQQLQKKKETLVGDVLLAASFVSYIGAFNQTFRRKLWEGRWVKDIVEKQIPLNQAVVDREMVPTDILTTGPEQAKWANEGLPADSISIENAAITVNCSRWPLFIDPQLQGVKWIKQRFAHLTETSQFKTVTLGQGRWLNVILHAVEQGNTVLIENCPEDLPAVLEPVLMRAVIKKGRSMRIRIAGEEKDYDPNFRLFLQTKLSNPHYKPEIFAQCTLINFIVTEEGLEEQLLALVVNREKPELEESKQALMRSINEFMVKLSDLEDDLLNKLSNAPDDILSDISLIEGLENTKAAATEIQKKVGEAKDKEIQINKARNEYRNVAKESSWIYFLLIAMNNIDHMYQYSLGAFITFFFKGMELAPTSAVTAERVHKLRQTIRHVVFKWVARGLFEEHKQIFVSQLCFTLMSKGALERKMNMPQFEFLLRGPKKFSEENPLDWLPDGAWCSICKLADIRGLERFAKDLVASPNRFKEWYLRQNPEEEPLPMDWRKLDENDPFAKLLIVRSMRPDRMLPALQKFVRGTLPEGEKYTELDAGVAFKAVLEQSLMDAQPTTPVFFILSSGADPVGTLYDRALADGLVEKGLYFRVALGQGQDVVAMEKLDIAHKNGAWIVLENIHLMPRWCQQLEKRLDEMAEEGSHENFRIFLSAEPSKDIPIGILERSIKLTNEPPQGMKANLKRAFATYDKEEFDFRDGNLKSLMFALCWFHAVIIERKKYGPKGWNAMYPFNTGDLINSATILVNKCETCGNKIPWDDLRYIFGAIMYGGHITDDWDRLLAMEYLRYYMKAELFDEMDLIPFVGDDSPLHFMSPSPMSHDEYFQYIDAKLPPENPIVMGLHPNTEIAMRTDQTVATFKHIMSLQTNSGGDGEGAGQSVSQRVSAVLDEILEKVEEVNFDLADVLSNLPLEERGPYQYVFMQETEMMTILTNEMKRSLRELDLGLKGELTMSERMEELQQALYLDQIPATWAKLAYPSLRPLSSFVPNLIDRVDQLERWTDDPTNIPAVVNVSYLFNPASFLTAVMQCTAQRNNMELDKLTIATEVTRKQPDDIDSAARDGVYVTGLNLEGAAWDEKNSCLGEARPREMRAPLPVVNCKAITVEKAAEKRDKFACPCYQTQQRGPTFVFTAPMTTKVPAAKWMLGGVVIIMDYVD